MIKPYNNSIFLPFDAASNHRHTHFDALSSGVNLNKSQRNYPKHIHAKGDSLFWSLVTLGIFIYGLRSQRVTAKLKQFNYKITLGQRTFLELALI